MYFYKKLVLKKWSQKKNREKVLSHSIICKASRLPPR